MEPCRGQYRAGAGGGGCPRTRPGGNGWHGLSGAALGHACCAGHVARSSRCLGGHAERARPLCFTARRELRSRGRDLLSSVLAPGACWVVCSSSLGCQATLAITNTMFSSSSVFQVSFTTVDVSHLALLF